MCVRTVSSLIIEARAFCHDVCTTPCPGGPKPPAPWPAPLNRTGSPEAMEEIPLERFEYLLDFDDWMDSRFMARGWIGFNGSRRDRLVVLRRMGLVVYERRLFCFLEGETV